MKLNFYTILLILILNMLFIACKQQPYQAISERIEIINQCNFTILVKWDDTNFYISDYYKYNERSLFDTVPPGRSCINSLTYINYHLIMPDSTFSRIISTIKICKIQNRDTTFVNTQKYINRSAWESFSGFSSFESMEGLTIERLKVTNAMFND